MNLATALESVSANLLPTAGRRKRKVSRESGEIPAEVCQGIIERRQAGKPWAVVYDYVRGSGVKARNATINQVWWSHCFEGE